MTAAQDYKLARELANKIAAAHTPPRFNRELNREREISRRMLHTDTTLEKSRQIVKMRDEHYGHGLNHLEKVATDAGAIVQNESTRMGNTPEQTERAVFLALLASLLHDIKRRVPDHARPARAQRRQPR